MRRPGWLSTRGRVAAAVAAAALLALALYASSFVVSYSDLLHADDPLQRTDVARLAPRTSRARGGDPGDRRPPGRAAGREGARAQGVDLRQPAQSGRPDLDRGRRGAGHAGLQSDPRDRFGPAARYRAAWRDLRRAGTRPR